MVLTLRGCHFEFSALAFGFCRVRFQPHPFLFPRSFWHIRHFVLLLGIAVTAILSRGEEDNSKHGHEGDWRIRINSISGILQHP